MNEGTPTPEGYTTKNVNFTVQGSRHLCEHIFSSFYGKCGPCRLKYGIEFEDRLTD